MCRGLHDTWGGQTESGPVVSTHIIQGKCVCLAFAALAHWPGSMAARCTLALPLQQTLNHSPAAWAFCWLCLRAATAHWPGSTAATTPRSRVTCPLRMAWTFAWAVRTGYLLSPVVRGCLGSRCSSWRRRLKCQMRTQLAHQWRLHTPPEGSATAEACAASCGPLPGCFCPAARPTLIKR